MTKTQQRITLSAFLLLPVLIFFLLKDGKVMFKHLNVLGEKYVDMLTGDTVYHTVPHFTFTDQLGRPVSNETFDSGLYIASFFFTTCKTVCPRINGVLLNLYEKNKEKPMVRFLSHTVDPETDSVSVLKNYAANLRTDPDKWRFVTGSKADLYRMAGPEGYLLPTGQQPGVPADSVKFFHSQQVVLMDNQRRVRGVYDVLLPHELKRLEDEMRVLLKEMIEERNNHAEKR